MWGAKDLSGGYGEGGGAPDEAPEQRVALVPPAYHDPPAAPPPCPAPRHHPGPGSAGRPGKCRWAMRGPDSSHAGSPIPSGPASGRCPPVTRTRTQTRTQTLTRSRSQRRLIRVSVGCISAQPRVANLGTLGYPPRAACLRASPGSTPQRCPPAADADSDADGRPGCRGSSGAAQALTRTCDRRGG